MTASVLVCGVDEAGRGPLAGPVYAAAVILGGEIQIDGIADSKKLTPLRRARLAAEIQARSRAWGVASASVTEIDALNILRASLLAMRRAVAGLRLTPTLVLIDGLHCPPLACAARPVVRGDATVIAIAAASILAKVARDTEMLELHRSYPQYGFDRHKGYPTAAHLAALRLHGVTAIHRRSFAPVKELLRLSVERAGAVGPGVRNGLLQSDGRARPFRGRAARVSVALPPGVATAARMQDYLPPSTTDERAHVHSQPGNNPSSPVQACRYCLGYGRR